MVALELLDLGDAGVGWLNAAWGAGGLLGGAVALALLGRGRLGGGLVTGGLLVGLPLVAIAAVREPLAIAALIGLLGVGYALIEVGGLSLLQRLSSDEVLGRAFAAVESTYWITTGLGAMLAPAAIALLGTSGALVAVGACLPLFVGLRARALRRLATVNPVPDDGFRALRSVPDFAPLPLATVENVARRLSELRLPAGTVVIREGDPGDCCYVVAEGRLDVSCDHVALRTAAAGELLGEIALLRDVVRTATVTACDDVVLYALQRGDFLSTVSAHPRTTEAVAATAAQRLEGSHDGDRLTPAATRSRSTRRRCARSATARSTRSWTSCSSPASPRCGARARRRWRAACRPAPRAPRCRGPSTRCWTSCARTCSPS